MPAVIVEGAFLDNDLDNNAIDTVAEQQGFGRAIAHGMLNQLNIAIKSTLKPVVIVKPVIKADTVYRVVTGSFENKENAEARIADLKKLGVESFIVEK